ncbi:hypothetical protein [Streptomyces sp. 147326]|uniref:hypothetical protein n=1 Tax=Streptomyces sp. 147326 TaxID=3074379 RepID=UPI0038575005
MTTEVSPRDALEKNGFVGPFPRFASEDTVGELREFFQDVLDNQPVHPLYNRYSVRDWHLVNEKVRELLTAPELIKSLEQATGADSLVLWRSKPFEKFPGDGAIDWHQEYGYFDGEEVGGHRPALPDEPLQPVELDALAPSDGRLRRRRRDGAPSAAPACWP